MTLHEVDGSWGEGGGQVLRLALALAVATGEDVRVTRVRAGRDRPGLRPQHLTAVTALAALCDATLDGASPGSREVTFRPGEVRGGSYRFDIGTAGSVPLLLQALLPACAASGRRFTFDLTGGTDVRWSPPWDYLAGVHIPLLAKVGLDVRARLKRRGHYPEGGGKVHVEVATRGLASLDLRDPGPAREALLRVHLANLPDHIPGRMAGAAAAPIEVALDVPVATAVDAAHGGPSAGCGITCILRTDGSVLGSDALGERGVPAEDVGRDAGEALVADATTGAAVDRHQVDQLLPFLALAGGGAVRAPELTGHASTTLELLEDILGVPWSVTRDEDGTVLVEVG